MKALTFALLASLSAAPAFAKSSVTLIRVYKSERRMELVGKNKQVIKTYQIMLGKEPLGHKLQEGDNKTPEGVYTLDTKNPKSKFYKSIHISYPNAIDIKMARYEGVEPGGNIMIHGLPNKIKEVGGWMKKFGLDEVSEDMIRDRLLNRDWTSGCIAVTNEEMDEIYNLIDVPTTINIKP